MEDPVSDISTVIGRLAQNDDIGLQQATLRRYFAPDAVLDTQLAYAKGVNEIASVYKLWSLVHQSVSFKVQRVVPGEGKNTVAVQGLLVERTWLDPLIRRELPYIALFRFEDSKVGKRIVLQHSFFVHNYLFAQLPLLGPIYMSPNGPRTLFAKFMFLTVQALDWTIGTQWIGNISSMVCSVIGT